MRERSSRIGRCAGVQVEQMEVAVCREGHEAPLPRAQKARNTSLQYGTPHQQRTVEGRGQFGLSDFRLSFGRFLLDRFRLRELLVEQNKKTSEGSVDTNIEHKQTSNVRIQSQ